MIEIYKQCLRAATAVLCAYLMAPAYASEPTIAGVWQQIDPGNGFVGGLISFKEKNGLWERYIVKMYPKPGDPVDPVCSGCTDNRKDQQVLGLRLIQNAKRAAADVAKRLPALPQVGQARTIDTFLPEGQAGKIAAIKSAADRLDTVLNPAQRPAPPTDADTIEALKSGAQNLLLLANAVPGPGGDAAKRLSADLDKLEAGPPTVRASMQAVLIQPQAADLEALRHALRPEGVTRATLPEAIRRAWVSPDGGARVELVPKAGHEFSAREFAQAVMKAEPTATGPAIGELEWGATIIRAFVLAGVCAFVSIAVLLWIVLRKVSDVALTLVPLLVAAVVTLELCALLDFPLNYANIIALPVLFGVGVAFKIYYVMAWRSGQSDFLQSPLTRAVLFSALMTATAFGSLSFSSHPGTASMGKLLALSLACTLASAALFQPALMGKPRRSQENG